MTNNTQLPAEVVEEIKDAAQKFANKSCDNESIVMYNFIAGATEYATKLHQANQEIEELRRRLTISEAACSTLNEQETEARDLLRIFISRHEAGLLPDRFIYNDIKSFLDGQK